MNSSRVIPCLLIKGKGLFKTKKFKDPVYIGDPINAVRIFSEKEVDELIILDIDATVEKKEPNYDLIAEIAGECFMPVAYGGGISNLEQVRKLIRSGIEKVVINSAACRDYYLISEIAKVYGSQAVVVAIDVKKKILGGYKVLSHSGTQETGLNLESYVAELVVAGAGEIFINSIDRDGLMEGYDLDLISLVSRNTTIPVVASGGAGTIDNFHQAIAAGASAVAAGSMFVFYGKHRAVLINYPVGLVI